MNIAYIAAGAGGMYCGSCIHDNTAAAAMRALGHDVTLIPTYTPMRTDEENVSMDRVFYGAVNVYLQGKSRVFRHAPRFVERWLDHPRLLRWVSRFAGSTDAKELGEMTLSVLQGEAGPQAGELDKLVTWLRDDLKPDLVHITNSMFLGMARRLRLELDVPVVVAVQGEDLFLGELTEPYRSKVLAELRTRARDASLFLAPSAYYARFMGEILEQPGDRFAVVPLGIHPDPYRDSPPAEQSADGPPRLGFFARLCPAKGLHLLVEAFRQLAQDEALSDLRLCIAGYLAEADRPYVEGLMADLEAAGLSDRVDLVGEVDLDGKVAFLRSLDVLSVPTVYREPKGIFALEAQAAGVPVVLPDHGSFPEMIEATGGGLLFEAGSVPSLVAALRPLLADPARRGALGAAGRQAVFERFNDRLMVEATLDLYAGLVAGESTPHAVPAV